MNTTKTLKDIIGYAEAKAIVDTFKFSGDWEIDHIRLTNALQSCYCDTIGVYNSNIEKIVKGVVNETIKANYTETKFAVDYSGDLYEEM